MSPPKNISTGRMWRCQNYATQERAGIDEEIKNDIVKESGMPCF